MAKGRIERTVDYINRDMFEQFMRLLMHPQQTWRYHREYYAGKSNAWPAYIARDFLLKFNPLSVMLASAFYVLSRTARALPKVLTVSIEGNYPKHVVTFMGVLTASILSYSLLEAMPYTVPYNDFGSALGFANFFPYETGIAAVVGLLAIPIAVAIYAVKSHLQNKALENSTKSTQFTPFNISDNNFVSSSRKENLAHGFSAQKYLVLHTPYFSSFYYTPGQGDDDQSKTSRLLSHLAATRYQVKNALQTAHPSQLCEWFGGRPIHNAEAWLRNVNKPALEAVYEKLKENYRACDTQTDASAPDEKFTEKLAECFNKSTPPGLRSSKHLHVEDKIPNKEILDKNIKPLFGPFIRNTS